MIFSTIVWTIIILLTIFLGTLVCLLGIIDKTGNLPHLIGKMWGTLICKISRVQVEVAGLEHVYTDKAQIFVSNHQGFFDIFVLFSCLPIQFRWIAKESLFSIPFVGWGMRACRYIRVNRSNKKEALKSFIAVTKKLHEGTSIIIFPEGTRGIEEKIGEFKKGALLLARRSKLPIVPITIQGSFQVMRKGSMRIHPGTIRVMLDKPLETSYLLNQQEDELMKTIRKIVINNSQGDT